MAFSVKIIGISKATGQSLLEMEPSWWDTNLLRKDKRFIESSETGYLDYDADLSIEEMRDMHEKFRPVATKGVYEYAGWQEIIKPMVTTLDEALYLRSDDYLRFHIMVFEWESGLD